MWDTDQGVIHGLFLLHLGCLATTPGPDTRLTIVHYKTILQQNTLYWIKIVYWWYVLNIYNMWPLNQYVLNIYNMWPLNQYVQNIYNMWPLNQYVLNIYNMWPQYYIPIWPVKLAKPYSSLLNPSIHKGQSSFRKPAYVSAAHVLLCTCISAYVIPYSVLYMQFDILCILLSLIQYCI